MPSSTSASANERLMRRDDTPLTGIQDSAQRTALVELDFHPHAGLRVADRDGVARALDAAHDERDGRAWLAQVAPPHLAIGPLDAERHAALVLGVVHGDGEVLA